MDILHQRLLVIVAHAKVATLRSKVFPRAGRQYSIRAKEKHIRDLINLGLIVQRRESPLPGAPESSPIKTFYVVTDKGKIKAREIVDRGALVEPDRKAG